MRHRKVEVNPLLLEPIDSSIDKVIGDAFPDEVTGRVTQHNPVACVSNVLPVHLHKELEVPDHEGRGGLAIRSPYLDLSPMPAHSNYLAQQILRPA
jgi:hypothetical protein